MRSAQPDDQPVERARDRTQWGGPAAAHAHPRATGAAGFDQALLWAAFAGTGLLLAVVGGALAWRSTLLFQINYNEGWNSYMTARVLQGLPLYPGRATHLVNNYPPLAFYLTAGLAWLCGDVLAAGRAMAWASLLACILLVGAVLRRMGARFAGIAFGSLFLATVLAVRCDLYVGMFDPQLLGQAIMLGGLWVLLRARTWRGAALAAVLTVAGGFVKHSLVALPAATALWLLWCRRDLVVPWALAGAGAAAAGLGACILGYGPEFLAGLLVPRHLDLGQGLRKVFVWLAPLQVACLLATAPCVRGGPAARFVGLYMAAGLLAGVAGAAPAATNYNMVFELLVAVSLGLGLLVGAPAERASTGWAAAMAAAGLWLAAAQLATAESTSWRAWSTEQLARADGARAAIALIRSRPGPALCGDLLLCFQAGKPFAYDPLNFGHAPGEDQSSLRKEIEERRFGAIQVSAANGYLRPETLAVIQQFYTPRSQFNGSVTFSLP